MHYHRSYKGMTPAQAYDASLQDIQDWLGVPRFLMLTKAFKESYPCGISFDTFANIVSLAGVQGFPVRAWFDHCFPFGDAPSHGHDYELHWHDIENAWLREHHPDGYER